MRTSKNLTTQFVWKILSKFFCIPRWQIDKGSNLDSLIKLLFYPVVILNNNLSHKIYCEKIIYITFLLSIMWLCE